MTTPQRYAQIIRLKPECVEEYIKIHNPIPEAIARRIKESHMTDYSIFYERGTGLLFASFKYTGTNFEQDMEEMKRDSATLQWWQTTDAMQESLNEGSAGSTDAVRTWWKPAEEVFRQE